MGTTNIKIDSSNSNYLITVYNGQNCSVCIASNYAGTPRFSIVQNVSGITYAGIEGLIGITCNEAYIYSVTKLCHLIQ